MKSAEILDMHFFNRPEFQMSSINQYSFIHIQYCLLNKKFLTELMQWAKHMPPSGNVITVVNDI